MDFYQDQANKDTSGWFGPAIVSDVSRLKHGAVTVRYNNKLREVYGNLGVKHQLMIKIYLNYIMLVVWEK